MAEKSQEARKKAEARFHQAETRKTEGEKAWAEHLAKDKSVQARTARLKSERLARDAELEKAPPPPAAPPKRKKPSK